MPRYKWQIKIYIPRINTFGVHAKIIFSYTERKLLFVGIVTTIFLYTDNTIRASILFDLSINHFDELYLAYPITNSLANVQ